MNRRRKINVAILVGLVLVVGGALAVFTSRPRMFVPFAVFSADGTVVRWECLNPSDGRPAINKAVTEALEACRVVSEGDVVYYGCVYLHHEIKPVKSMPEFVEVCREALRSPGQGYSFWRIRRTDAFYVQEGGLLGDGPVQWHPTELQYEDFSALKEQAVRGRTNRIMANFLETTGASRPPDKGPQNRNPPPL